jgi:hypothetical protein
MFRRSLPVIFTLLFLANLNTYSQEVLYGSISGKVLHKDNPVVGARLEFIPDNAQQLKRSAISNENGEYNIQRLTPGVYSLTVYKDGYVVKSEEGKAKVAITKGSSVKQDITMSRGGVIYGKVLDSKGNGVPGISVSAIKINLDKKRIIPLEENSPGNPTITDDRGHYRMYSLVPGTYVVGVNVNSSGHWKWIGSSYYPGVRELSKVAYVNLLEAEEKGDIDIKVDLARKGFAFTGTLISSIDSNPLRGVDIRLLKTSDIPAKYFARTDEGGIFKFEGLSAGDYKLTTLNINSPLTNVDRNITIVNSDLSNFPINVNPVPAMKGAVYLMDGKLLKPYKEPNLGVGLIRNGKSELKANIDEKGAFSLSPLVQGVYHWRFYGLPKTVYVKSILNGNEDITVKALKLSGEEPLNEIKIILSDKSSVVKGTISKENFPTGFDLDVFLFPTEHERFISELFNRRVKVDPDGKFEITRVGPGRYYFVAVGSPKEKTQNKLKAVFELIRKNKITEKNILILKEGESKTEVQPLVIHPN